MRPDMRWLLVALLACAHLKHSYVAGQVPEECSVCKTCIECTKCQSPCQPTGMCNSPLCEPCENTDGQSDGKNCYETTDEVSLSWKGYCGAFCSPACTFCSDCDRCDEFCAPCNKAPCNQNTCSLGSITHDQCDNGDQCSAGCLSACAPCLNCAQCAGCRQECGHCDDCFNYPESGACATNSCDSCGACEPCMTCEYTDGGPCDICKICVITHNDEKAWDRNNGSVFVQPSERAFDPSAPPSPAVASQSFNEFTSEVMKAQQVRTQSQIKPLTIQEISQRRGGGISSSGIENGSRGTTWVFVSLTIVGAVALVSFVMIREQTKVRHVPHDNAEKTTLLSGRSDTLDLTANPNPYGAAERGPMVSASPRL